MAEADAKHWFAFMTFNSSVSSFAMLVTHLGANFRDVDRLVRRRVERHTAASHHPCSCFELSEPEFYFIGTELMAQAIRSTPSTQLPASQWKK
jgi:hypothetical protein